MPSERPPADDRTGRTLLAGFDLVATFDDADRLVPGGDVLVDGPVIDRVGAHDPLAGLLLAGLGSHAALVLVGGRILVEGGVAAHLDPPEVAAAARAHLAAG